MRTFLLNAVVCFLFVVAVAAQDTLPDGGQPPAANPGRPVGQGGVPAANIDPTTFRAQVSYALGQNFAMSLRENEVECDLKSLIAGISDTLRGAKPKWSEQQLGPVMQRFRQEMQQKAETRFQRQAVKNQREAADFLAQNGKKEGVQTTPSGLQYRVIREGNGPSPTLNDTVRCNYRGVLLNGTEFDSSAQNGGPTEFPVNEVIAGWQEALQKMRVGDKWQLFVPPKLAYDVNPRGPLIEPNSLLVFEIELLEIVHQ